MHGLNKLILLILLFTSFDAFSGADALHDDDGQGISSRTSTIGKAEGILTEVLKYVPSTKYREALETYVDIIFGQGSYKDHDGVVADANKGMERHFRLKENDSPCFKNAKDRLVSEIKSIDMRLPSFSESRRLRRPSLADKAGESGRYQSVEKGRIWKLALAEVPNNKPALALRLLASIGHDDIIDQVDIDSSLFANEALGDGVMVSEGMANRVARQQAPNLGGEVIPSKNYHIIASAYNVCRLIEGGVNPKIAKFIQTSFAKAYRSLRLQQAYSEYDAYEDKVLKTFFIGDMRQSGALSEIPKEFQVFTRFYPQFLRETSSFCRGDEIDFILINKLKEVRKKRDGQNFSERDFEKEICYDKAPEDLYDTETLLRKGLGFSLYRRIYSRVSLSESRSFATGGIKFDLAVSHNGDIDMSKIFLDGMMSEEEAKIAKEFTESIAVDMDWTEELHGVGSDFAIEHCKAGNLDEDWDKLFCFDQNNGDRVDPCAGAIELPHVPDHIDEFVSRPR